MQSFLFKKKALMFTKVIQEKAEKSKIFKQSRYSDIKNKFMLKKNRIKYKLLIIALTRLRILVIALYP